jgi:ubiquinone/menaquinone biosynthesis C-methylase UbiE
MRYAAVDIGSNSLRMLAAEISPGHPPRQLAEERIVTRLGEGVFRDGAISARSFDELIVALTRMADTYRGLDVAGVRAVATSAVRDASNQAEFLERASEALGSPIEIISGREEARLIHRGVLSRWPQKGSRLLLIDIGGGSGEPSLTISPIVGPTGSVMYTDPVAGMVETAQKEVGKRCLTNIQFRQCSADDLPFGDHAFDAAVGRLSAMFFVDPVTAVREALRVILEDGYVSFVVWGPKEANPFFSSVADVIDRFVESPPEDPDAPDAFRFALPGKLPGILKNAGAKNVTERQLNFQIKAAISFEQFWQVRTEMSETLREKMAGLAPAQISTIKQAVADAARRYFVSGTMSFPAEALIVSGRKSAV